MPIFEYQCEKCGHKFEELIFGKKKKVYCPKCKSARVKRLVSKISIGKKESFDSDKGECPLCKI